MTELIKSLNSSLSFGQEAVTFCLPWAGHCLLVFSNQWFSNQITCLVSKGWCSGQTARLPPMWPGFKSRRWSHMWVEFVVGFLLCSERFLSGYSGFPLSSKTNISKFQIDQESVTGGTTLWMCYLKSLFIYLFIIYLPLPFGQVRLKSYLDFFRALLWQVTHNFCLTVFGCYCCYTGYLWP